MHSTRPTVDAAITLIWTEIQMHFSVICSVSYCFRSFTKAVSTNYGCTVINLDAYETSGSSNAYASSKKNSKTTTQPSLHDQQFVGHRGKYTSTTIITSGGKRPRTSNHRPRKSGESTMVIIQEEVHVESSRTTPTKELITPRISDS